MALIPTKSELPMHPSLLCLLELSTTGVDGSTTSDTLIASGVLSQTVKQDQCYCVLHTDSNSDSLSGWGGRSTEFNTAHCRVSHNSTSLSSQSDPQLTAVSKTSSSHKSSFSRAPSIGKSDSQCSLKSWTFELQPIPYKFSHCEDEDMSVFADSYRNSYTYHNMEQRLKSSSANVCGQVPLRTSFHPSAQFSTMVKPKLMVLGERSQACKYAKPFRRGSQGYRKCISFETTDISTNNILPSKPKCDRCDSSSLQSSATLLVTEKGNVSALSADYRSTSNPSLAASLVEEHTHSELTNPVKHITTIDCYPKSALAADTHRTNKNAESRLSIKWTSKSFPSFVVCSVDKDSQKTKMATTNKKRLHQPQRPSNFKTKTPLQLSSLGSKSMPAISRNGMATRSEFGHLLSHQHQVNFGNARPGFRYETLCLQGHNANSHNTHPVTVVGPWISTP